MEAKKATKTVGQHKSPLGWSKVGKSTGKNIAMDSTGGSITSSSDGSSSTSRLEDSALLISPPNQVPGDNLDVHLTFQIKPFVGHLLGCIPSTIFLERSPKIFFHPPPRPPQWEQGRVSGRYQPRGQVAVTGRTQKSGR